MAQSGASSDYPVQFSVDYPESRNRLSVLFRLILAIPIVIVGAAVGGHIDMGDAELTESFAPLYAGGVLWIGPLLMIVFRKKYPKWWFDWNLELSRFTTRIESFILVLRDEYPSTDEEQSVHLQIEYPNAETELNRILPIFKWLLAIPHYIILAILWVLAIVATILAWLSILGPGPVSRGAVQLRGRGDAVELPGRGVCVPADDGPVSSVPPERIRVKVAPRRGPTLLGGGSVSFGGGLERRSVGCHHSTLRVTSGRAAPRQGMDSRSGAGMTGKGRGVKCPQRSLTSVTMTPPWAMRAANVHFKTSDLLLAIFASRFASLTSSAA